MSIEFGKRLKTEREKKGWTRPQLAEASGVAVRTIQNYENSTRCPGRVEICNKLAAALDVPPAYLLGESEAYHAHMEQAREIGGVKSVREVKAMVDDISCCFAGGELPEEDLEAMMDALIDAYRIAKNHNKKYANRKSTAARG